MSALPNLSRAVGHWPVPLEPTDYADKVQEQGGHVVWFWVSSKATSHQSAGPLLNVWHFSTVAAQAHRSHQQVQSIVTHRDHNCTVPRAPGPRMFPGRRSVPSTGLGTGGGRPCCYRAPVRSLSTPAGSTGPLDDQPCGGHALILKQQQRLSQHSHPSWSSYRRRHGLWEEAAIQPLTGTVKCRRTQLRGRPPETRARGNHGWEEAARFL